VVHSSAAAQTPANERRSLRTNLTVAVLHEALRPNVAVTPR
jgi:hypothetical protein